MGGDAVIVAGFGFRAGAGVDSLRDALARAADGRAVAALATAAAKAESAVFRQLADEMQLPIVAVPAQALAAQDTPTRSAASTATHATGSVAEAAALVAAAPARLLAPRTISADRMATCALARTEHS